MAPGAAGPVVDGFGPQVRASPSIGRLDPRKGLPPGFWNYDGDAPLPELEQRIAQLGAIASTRGPASTAATTYVLRADPDPQARKAAIGVLAGLRPSDDARKALTQAVADPDADVRAAALRALSRGGGEKPVALLAQAAKGDTDIGVRRAAIEIFPARTASWRAPSWRARSATRTHRCARPPSRRWRGTSVPFR